MYECAELPARERKEIEFLAELNKYSLSGRPEVAVLLLLLLILSKKCYYFCIDALNMSDTQVTSELHNCLTYKQLVSLCEQAYSSVSDTILCGAKI